MPKTRSSRAGRRHVFISHSSVDTWVAQQIAREVKACGAVPFLDENDIDVGAEFEERLLESLSVAHELVVLLTPWALLRPYVWAEIGAAWGRRIPIVVLLHGLTIAELQSKPEIPLLIKKRSFISLNEVDTYLKELRTRVREHARKRRPGA
uniref:Toll/interleukin-1 receptor domain-containing protein n=1 Tax=Schlesneria paludicola TaxID=360056 RepID=A0A7C2P085_9PLAN